jgi:transposase
VALMDLSGFEATCKVGKAGQAPFSPRVLLALLIHAYSHGIRSSRAIERLCGRDVRLSLRRRRRSRPQRDRSRKGQDDHTKQR